jgi:hypothetical protein
VEAAAPSGCLFLSKSCQVMNYLAEKKAEAGGKTDEKIRTQ